MQDLQKYIRNVPDFPVEGIQFKDITTLIKDGELFAQSVDYLYNPFRHLDIDKIAAVEARGFIFGAALAYKLNIGFVPIRKPGKLPAATSTEEYESEYGKSSLEIHNDGIGKDDRILFIDDLLATGGTAISSIKLIENLGGIILGASFLVELTDLKGRELLRNYKVHSLIKFNK